MPEDYVFDIAGISGCSLAFVDSSCYTYNASSGTDCKYVFGAAMMEGFSVSYDISEPSIVMAPTTSSTKSVV